MDTSGTTGRLPRTRARTLARAVTAPGTAALAAFIDDGMTAGDVRWLAKQGIASYARYRLRQAGLLSRLAPEVAAPLSLAYSLSAVHEAAQHEGTLAGTLR